MATYRKIHVSFWGDPFIQDLTPEQKYFFLYLLTNERTAQCGIYEISVKNICFDTGYNADTVLKLMEFFEKSGKIRYSKTTNEVAIKNWDKYNGSESSNVKILVNQQLNNVKDRVLIEYLHSTDTYALNNNNNNNNNNRNKEKPKVSIPPKGEFLSYVEERCASIGVKFSDYKQNASVKYDAWVANKWKDLKGNSIVAWKGKVVSNLQYWKSESVKPSQSGTVDLTKDYNYENQY